MQSSSIDDSGLEGHPSETVEVVIRVNPMPPIIRPPLDGAEQKDPYVHIFWLKVQDAERYNLQIADDAEIVSIVEEQDSLQDNTYRTKKLTMNRLPGL